MNFLNKLDTVRISLANKNSKEKKSSIGQYHTPANISTYMASLFENLAGDLNILDPGCGIGILSMALI